MRTEAAQVAAIIRAELKAHGIKARVTSENYAGGNTVRVYLNDELPATVEKIKAFCNQYKAGHFDGMTDCYMYDSSKSGPTVKFIFVENEFSDELRARAKEFVNSFYANPGVGTEYSSKVWQQLSQKDSAFWKANKPRIAA